MMDWSNATGLEQFHEIDYDRTWLFDDDPNLVIFCLPEATRYAL